MHLFALDCALICANKYIVSFLKYTVRSLILWIGCILALLCTTVDTWNPEMVLCPFFYRPSKVRLGAWGVFRKKVTVVKGSCLQEAEIKNVTV
jgi:hypothetical protein